MLRNPWLTCSDWCNESSPAHDDTIRHDLPFSLVRIAGSDGSGIHGRDSSGKFFSILQADEDTRKSGGLRVTGETTGLAFSPDSRFMYVTYQEMGMLLELRRIDGLPFNGKRLDIKYHQAHSKPPNFWW